MLHELACCFWIVGGVNVARGSDSKKGRDVASRSAVRYFSSEWSFAQFRIPGYSKSNVAMKAICAFGAEENTLLTITADGKFLKCNFARGGDCVMESFAKFAKHDPNSGSGSGTGSGSGNGSNGSAPSMPSSKSSKGGN